MGKLMRNGIDYSGVQVDETLNLMSKNPVENRAVATALDTKVNTADLGTAAAKDVPTSGNASATQVVLGNDGRLAWMDTNGDIYFGSTRIARVMDEASYRTLVDSGETENIYYLIYPTPTNGRSLSVNLQNSVEPEEDDMRTEPEEEPTDEPPNEDDMR